MNNNQNKPFWNNRYILEKLLGQGGMGKVYLATDSLTNELVAVKECMAPVERIRREYYYMNKISHDNLVKAKDFFPLNGNYCIVMEYVDGIDLNSFIMNHKNSIPIEKQMEIAQEICSAVAVLNENGIIHRDIKPENIILTKNNLRPKLLDLGIAKSLGQEITALTREGSIIGTPQYMSPEQLNGKIFPNTDVFLLGILLYQFFSWSNNSPFEGGNYMASIRSVSELRLPKLFPESLGEYYSSISEVVQKALEKDYTKRIQSTRGLWILLDEKKSFSKNNKTEPLMVETVLLKATKPAIKNFPKVNRTLRTRKVVRKNRAPLITIGCVIITIIFAVVVYFLQTSEQEIEIYLAKAQTAFSNKKYEEAENLYERVLKLAPNSKKAQEAIQNIKKKKQAQELLLKATQAFVQKKYADAKKYYQEASYLDYELEEVRNGINQITEQEIKEQNNTLQEQNNTLQEATYYYETGNLYYHKGQYELAEKNYNKSIELNPKHPLAYNNRGIAYNKQGKFDLAEKDYNKALELDSKLYLGYNNRGYLYYEQGKFDLAEKDYSKAIELDSKPLGAYNNRGLLYYQQRKFDLAEIDFSKAIEIDPKFQSAYYNRGLVYEQKKKNDLAEKDYNTAIELDPKFGLAYANRGTFYCNQGKPLLAMSDWEKAISLGVPKTELDPWINKAQKLIKQQK